MVSWVLDCIPLAHSGVDLRSPYYGRIPKGDGCRIGAVGAEGSIALLKGEVNTLNLTEAMSPITIPSGVIAPIILCTDLETGCGGVVESS